MEARTKGQKALLEYLKETKKTHPLLVARFAATQISTEIGKLTQEVTKQDSSSALDLPKYVEKGSPEYGIGDHFERLRYLDQQVPEEETKVIQGVFSNSLPGLDQFLTDERHAIMLSKVAYNAIGVTFSGGRDDRVSAARFESCVKPHPIPSSACVPGTPGRSGANSYTLRYQPSSW